MKMLSMMNHPLLSWTNLAMCYGGGKNKKDSSDEKPLQESHPVHTSLCSMHVSAFLVTSDFSSEGREFQMCVCCDVCEPCASCLLSQYVPAAHALKRFMIKEALMFTKYSQDTNLTLNCNYTGD